MKRLLHRPPPVTVEVPVAIEEPPAPQPIRQGFHNIDHLIDEMLADMLVRPAEARRRIADRLGVSPESIVALETSRVNIPLELDAVFADPLGKGLVDEYRR
ncbi:MAG: hypothetical protein JOY97_03400, partial [Hyphomicrobiales bacterium]|nr:hypothetical protein [Hyphomicrobiales bacterium]